MATAVACLLGGAEQATASTSREGAGDPAFAVAILFPSYVTGDGARVRSGPSTDRTIVGLAYYGQRFFPYCMRKDATTSGAWVWGQVNNATIGWVHASLLHINSWPPVGMC